MSYCENFFKHDDNCSYFQGADPLRDHLDQEMINLFVVNQSCSGSKSSVAIPIVLSCW